MACRRHSVRRFRWLSGVLVGTISRRTDSPSPVAWRYPATRPRGSTARVQGHESTASSFSNQAPTDVNEQQFKVQRKSEPAQLDVNGRYHSSIYDRRSIDSGVIVLLYTLLSMLVSGTQISNFNAA